MSARRRRGPVVALALALVLVGCGGPDRGLDGTDPLPTPTEPRDLALDVPEGSTMAARAEAGSLRVGVAFGRPGLVQGEGAAAAGFEVELAELLAASMGIERSGLDLVDVAAPGAARALAEGEVDLVLGPQAEGAPIDLAGPYYVAGKGLLVRADDGATRSPADLAGEPVCVAGEAGERALAARLPAAEAEVEASVAGCARRLLGGEVTAVAGDDLLLAGLAATRPAVGEVRFLGAPVGEVPYWVGVAPGDDELRAFVEEVLARSFRDGTWEAAYASSFGPAGTEAPDPPALRAPG